MMIMVKHRIPVLLILFMMVGCDKDEGNGNGNGDQEEGCLIEVVAVSFQSEIDAASDGDTVIVQPGTYEGSIDFKGKNIVVGSLFLTTGDEDYMETTIIDAKQKGSVVKFENNEGPDAALIGLTITGGLAYEGGGIYINNASPTLRNLLITGNEVQTCIEGKTTITASGGGIYMNNSQSIFNTVFINDNKSEIAGGGIFMQSSSPYFRNVSVRDDTASDGGGIYMKASNPEMVRMIIDGNWADRGGGVFFSLSSPSIENVIVTGNSAEIEGGGMYLINSGPDALNITVSDNSASKGGGMYMTGSSFRFINTQLYYDDPQEIYFEGTGTENSVSISYSNVEGGIDGISVNANGIVTWGEGNITDDGPTYGDGCACGNWEGGSPYCMEGPGGIPLEGSVGWDLGNSGSQYNDLDGTTNNMGAYGGPNGDCAP